MDFLQVDFLSLAFPYVVRRWSNLDHPEQAPWSRLDQSVFEKRSNLAVWYLTLEDAPRTIRLRRKVIFA